VSIVARGSVVWSVLREIILEMEDSGTDTIREIVRARIDCAGLGRKEELFGFHV